MKRSAFLSTLWGTVVALFIGKHEVKADRVDIMEVRSSEDELIFRITSEGKVILGAGVKPDEAAIEFWRAIEKSYRLMCFFNEAGVDIIKRNEEKYLNL